MGMINTGKQRAKVLEVTKTVGGESLPDYPHTYRFCNKFVVDNVTYDQMDETELGHMPVNKYEERLGAFKQYIENTEPGVEVNMEEAYNSNTEFCPLP